MKQSINLVARANNMASASTVESPCVRNCCLDDDDICMGCFRTLDEIKDWSSCPDYKKLSVLKNCLQRRQMKKQRKNPLSDQEQEWKKCPCLNSFPIQREPPEVRQPNSEIEHPN